MKPRVETKAVELLRAGQALTKYDLAKAAPCDQKTAQRVLAKLHSGGIGVRIVWWQQVYYQRIPIYHMSAGMDVKKPEAMDNPARQRKLREKKKWI